MRKHRNDKSTLSSGRGEGRCPSLQRPGRRQDGARTASPPHHASCQTELMDHLDMALLVSLPEQSVPSPCH